MSAAAAGRRASGALARAARGLGLHVPVAALALGACLSAGAPSAGSGDGSGDTSSGGTLGMSSTSGASLGSTSTADLTTTTASTGSTSASDGCAFVCMPDLGGGDRYPRICDPYGHECPAGQKCAPWGEDGYGGYEAAVCVPVAREPKGPGEPCTLAGDLYSGLDDCVEGALCVDIDAETHVGTCVALCTSPEGFDGCNEDILSCCPPDQLCESNRVFGVCLTPCHPLTDSCPKGEGCYSWGGSDFHCYPDESGDLGAPGEYCGDFTQCDPGVFCGPPGGYVGCDPNPDVAGCCAPFCDLKAPNCAEGSVCEPWYGPMDLMLPFYVDLGVCQLPG